MARQLLIKTDTRCGACLGDVVLLQGVGYHVLVEFDSEGIPVPHCCPQSAVAAWKLRHRRRYRSLLARLDKVDRHEPG